ncbi:MAG: hypothetical protein KF847_06970 [Pirellulales bacterium]|nr:hypothetical protein [Pirellulales bacterium]
MLRRTLLVLVLTAAALASAPGSFAREGLTPSDGAKRAKTWEKEIAAIENRHAKTPVPERAIIFTGSSSVRLWDVAKGFPDLPVVNHGFGGSQICDATHFAERLVLKHKPSVIVFYSGDNDAAGGLSAEQIHRDFQEFVATVRAELPTTPIIVISAKPSVARWKLADKMRAANQRIAADCRRDETLEFVDVWPAMLGDDGRPRPEIFREDGLHLNDAGYAAWVEVLTPVLAKAYADSRPPALGQRLKPIAE